MYEYIGNKYNRQRKPHPETVTKLAKLSAQKIAQEKGIRPEDVTATEILGIETNAQVPPVQQELINQQTPPPVPVKETGIVEEVNTPEGDLVAEELIKKYS